MATPTQATRQRPRSKSMGGAPVDAETNAGVLARRRELLVKCGELLEEVHQEGGRSHLTIRAAVDEELAQCFVLEAQAATAAFKVPVRTPSKPRRGRSSKRSGRRKGGNSTKGSVA